LGIIYQTGDVDKEELAKNPGETELSQALRAARWDHGAGRFTVPVALSLMVFFALCCQCASTLAIIRRETNSWRWPAFTFVYMTALAYVGALLVSLARNRKRHLLIPPLPIPPRSPDSAAPALRSSAAHSAQTGPT